MTSVNVFESRKPYLCNVKARMKFKITYFYPKLQIIYNTPSQGVNILLNYSLMARKNKLAVIVGMKCPRCHQGDLFSAPITQGIYKMHKECPVCKQSFELEPGFYWGAMYVGYALSGGYMLSTVGLLLLVFNWTVEGAFAVSIMGGLFIFPFIARLARAVWLNIYVGYNKKYDPNINKEPLNNVKAALEDK